MSVLVYAATDPCRAEIEIDGEVFASQPCKSLADAIRVAIHVVRALGLAPLDPNVGSITIDGKPLGFTAPESKL